MQPILHLSLPPHKEHYKAGHPPGRSIIGPGFPDPKMSDDGEPAGTAGVPMLEVLKTTSAD